MRVQPPLPRHSRNGDPEQLRGCAGSFRQHGQRRRAHRRGIVAKPEVEQSPDWAGQAQRRFSEASGTVTALANCASAETESIRNRSLPRSVHFRSGLSGQCTSVREGRRTSVARGCHVPRMPSAATARKRSEPNAEGPKLFRGSSVVTTTERTFVIRNRDGRAEWVDVKKGAADGDLVEVVGNLRPGDKVVRRATDEMREGSEVPASK